MNLTVANATKSVAKATSKRARSKKAEGQAAYRRRQRDGLGCYMLDDLPTVELEEMLRGARLLTVAEPVHETTRLALKQLVLDLIKDHLAHGA